MASDVKVYISMKDGGDRRLTVDGSMALVIDILRELGREVLAERERAATENADCARAPEQKSFEAAIP